MPQSRGRSGKRTTPAAPARARERPESGRPEARTGIFETPTTGQEDLLAKQADEGKGLEPVDGERGTGGPLHEDLVEEEDPTPPMGGHDDDLGYAADPDDDFSERVREDDPLEARSAGDHVPEPPLYTDILVVEDRTTGQRTFRPHPVSPVGWHRWGLNAGARGPVRRQGRQTLQYLRTRQKLLVQIAAIITEHQRRYFERLFDDGDPPDAFLTLKPLTYVEVGRRLGIDHETVGDLAKSSYLQAHVVGSTPLPMSVFFGDGGRLGVREDVLADHLRRHILEAPALTVNGLRERLEAQGIIPQSRDDAERRSTNERLRQVMQAYQLPSRAQRMRVD